MLKYRKFPENLFIGRARAERDLPATGADRLGERAPHDDRRPALGGDHARAVAEHAGRTSARTSAIEPIDSRSRCSSTRATATRCEPVRRRRSSTLDVNREMPDCVFVEDTAIVLDEVAVMMSLGARVAPRRAGGHRAGAARSTARSSACQLAGDDRRRRRRAVGARAVRRRVAAHERRGHRRAARRRAAVRLHRDRGSGARHVCISRPRAARCPTDDFSSTRTGSMRRPLPAVRRSFRFPRPSRGPETCS